MRKNELLKLGLTESRDLGNKHKLFSHELFTLLFIEKDGEYEVWEEDKSRLQIIKDLLSNKK